MQPPGGGCERALHIHCVCSRDNAKKTRCSCLKTKEGTIRRVPLLNVLYVKYQTRTAPVMHVHALPFARTEKRTNHVFLGTLLREQWTCIKVHLRHTCCSYVIMLLLCITASLVSYNIRITPTLRYGVSPLEMHLRHIYWVTQGLRPYPQITSSLLTDT